MSIQLLTTFVDDGFIFHVFRANCETTGINSLGRIKSRKIGMDVLESIQGVLSEFEARSQVTDQ